MDVGYIFVCVLPHDIDEGRDGDEDDHREQNQENHQTQITFIRRHRIWKGRGRKKTTREVNKTSREIQREKSNRQGKFIKRKTGTNGKLKRHVNVW